VLGLGVKGSLAVAISTVLGLGVKGSLAVAISAVLVGRDVKGACGVGINGSCGINVNSSNFVAFLMNCRSERTG